MAHSSNQQSNVLVLIVDNTQSTVCFLIYTPYVSPFVIVCVIGDIYILERVVSVL